MNRFSLRRNDRILLCSDGLTGKLADAEIQTIITEARHLGKQACLEILGPATEVDRDILEKLEAPLTHLLRNAVDHGLENPVARSSADKPVEGVVRVEARHRAGMLAITVSDDGAGIDVERIRKKAVERGHATAEMAARLSDAELLEFLFLPGFSTAGRVTEVSGRGVGLDVVQDTVRRVGGSVQLISGRHYEAITTLAVVEGGIAALFGHCRR